MGASLSKLIQDIMLHSKSSPEIFHFQFFFKVARQIQSGKPRFKARRTVFVMGNMVLQVSRMLLQSKIHKMDNVLAKVYLTFCKWWRKVSFIVTTKLDVKLKRGLR